MLLLTSSDMEAKSITSGADEEVRAEWHGVVPIRPNQTESSRLAIWAERRQVVGLRIRELRNELGLSQESLALEAGLSRNMVIGIEWGRKSLAYERLFDIADVLGVSVSALLEPALRSTAKDDTSRG